MNHSFTPSNLDNTKCQLCSRDEKTHGNEASCDFCNYIGPVDKFLWKDGRGIVTTAIGCPSCKSEQENQLPETVKDILVKKQELDNKIQVLPDFFNAEVISINELRTVIEESDIENKPFHLATQLMDRYNHYKQVIFQLQQDIVEKANRQRAVQTELNNLANQLRTEEREKLRIADINYKPAVHVKVASAKPITTKKFSKKELDATAAEYGVPAMFIQLTATQKNISLKEAAIQVKMEFSAIKKDN